MIMLNAGRCAPSAENLQPWRFIVLQDNRALMENIASLSVYEKFLKTASCFILVYLDTQTITDRLFNCELKHRQAIAAALQNMMLAGHEMGLGTCWIGEILKREADVYSLV
jgi:nitroreductase